MTTAQAQAEDFCFGFLNAVPNRKEIPTAEAEEIQKGHIEHMGNMAKAGRLLAAGPFMTPGTMRGVVVYRCASLEETVKWTAKDPAVINNRLTLDLHIWRGPDDFGEPLAGRFKADPDTKIEMTKLSLVLFRKTSNWSSKAPADEQRGAAQKLLADGVLRTAGPFVDSKQFAALWVFGDMALEEAAKFAENTPLVKGGYATVQALTWFIADDAIPKRGR